MFPPYKSNGKLPNIGIISPYQDFPIFYIFSDFFPDYKLSISDSPRPLMAESIPFAENMEFLLIMGHYILHL